MNFGAIKIVLAAVGGAVVGGASVYHILNKHLESKWQGIADEQILSVKDHYRIIRGEGVYADPENLARPTQGRSGEDFNEDYPKDEVDLQKLANDLVDAGYVPVRDAIHAGASDDELIEQLREARERRLPDPDEWEDTRVEDVVGGKIESNVFDRKIPQNPDGSPRDPRYPYVISIDDFAVPEAEKFEAFETVTIKYFAKDKILLDSKGEIELDVNGVVGVDNLQKFGYMSQDEDVVYVRNEKLALVFEVLRLDESYVESKGLALDPEEEDGYIQRRNAKKGRATARFSED